MKIHTLHSDRLIVEVEINGKKGCMLVDTGASISLIDIHSSKHYGFAIAHQLASQVIGIGGESGKVFHARKLSVNIQGIPIHQFVTTDLSVVKESIKKKTDIEIVGIIGLPQVKSMEMKIDADNGLIILGY